MNKRKIISCLLAVIMTINAFPITALADPVNNEVTFDISSYDDYLDMGEDWDGGTYKGSASIVNINVNCDLSGHDISFAASPCESDSYNLTEDTDIDSEKVYYINTGSVDEPVFVVVETPTLDDIGSYYEKSVVQTGEVAFNVNAEGATFENLTVNAYNQSVNIVGGNYTNGVLTISGEGGSVTNASFDDEDTVFVSKSDDAVFVFNNNEVTDSQVISDTTSNKAEITISNTSFTENSGSIFKAQEGKDVDVLINSVSAENCDDSPLDFSGSHAKVALSIDDFTATTTKSDLTGILIAGTFDAEVSISNTTLNGFDVGVDIPIGVSIALTATNLNVIDCLVGLKDYASLVGLKYIGGTISGREGANENEDSYGIALTNGTFSYWGLDLDNTANSNRLDGVEITGVHCGVSIKNKGHILIDSCDINDVDTGILESGSSGVYVCDCSLTAKENPSESSYGYNMRSSGPIIDTDIQGFYIGIDNNNTGSISAKGCQFIDNIKYGANIYCSGFYDCIFSGDTEVFINKCDGDNAVVNCKFVGNGENIGISQGTVLYIDAVNKHYNSYLDSSNRELVDNGSYSSEFDSLLFAIKANDMNPGTVYYGGLDGDKSVYIHDCDTAIYTSSTGHCVNNALTLKNNRIGILFKDTSTGSLFTGKYELDGNSEASFEGTFSSSNHVSPTGSTIFDLSNGDKTFKITGNIIFHGTTKYYGFSRSFYYGTPSSFIAMDGATVDDDAGIVFAMPDEDYAENRIVLTSSNTVWDGKLWSKGGWSVHSMNCSSDGNMMNENKYMPIRYYLHRDALVKYDYTTNGGTSLAGAPDETDYPTLQFISPTTGYPVDTEDGFYKYESGANVDVTNITGVKDGWTFVGWNTDKDATTGLDSYTLSDVIENDVTLYAIYSKDLTVSYHTYSSATDYEDVHTVYNNTAIPLSSVLIDYQPANHSEYSFVGYTLDADESDLTDGNLKVSGDAISIPADGLDVYCVYEKTGNLTYKEANDTTIDSDNSTVRSVAQTIVSQKYSYVLADKTPTEGYVFDGWLDSSDVLHAVGTTYETTVKNDFVKAKETEILADGIVVTPKTSEIWIGDTVQLTAVVTPSIALDKSVAWSADASGVASVNNNGLVTANSVGTATITATNAKSGKSDTATVTVKKLTAIYDYQTNGGTSMTSVSDVAYKPGMDLDLTPIATKSGYTFVGWNTNKDATTGLNKVTFEDSNVTVYAIYKKDVTITYHTYNAASNFTDTVTFYNKETSKTKSLSTYSVAVSDLYDFVGYVLDENTLDFADMKQAGDTVQVPVGGLDVYCVYDTQSLLRYLDVDGITLLDSDTKSVRAIAESICNQVFKFICISKIPHDNHTFNGWMDSDGTLHASNTQYIITDHEATLIANESEILGDSIIVSPKESTIYFGDSIQLTAVVTPASTFDKSVLWTSSNETNATVTNTGLVTGLVPGTDVTITATNTRSGLSDTAVVHVKKLSAIYNYSENGGTSMSEVTPVNYKPDMTLDLTPTATKPGWTFVGWNTDKNATTGLSSVVFEDSDITVYAIYKKTATITYHTYNSDNNYTDTVDFYNKETTKQKALVAYSPEVNDLYTFVGYVLDANETNLPDALKAAGVQVSVSSNGLDVYCVYNTQSVLTYLDVDGATQIDTDSKNIFAVAEAVVRQAFVYVLIDKVPHDGYKFEGWLDSNGGLHESNSQYIITDHEASLVAKESPVTQPSLIVSPKNNEIYFGETVQLTATITPDDLADKTIIWSSSDNTVATVDEKGLVTGIKPGVVTITATNVANNLSDTASVTVKELNLIYDYQTNGGTYMQEVDHVSYKPGMTQELTANAFKQNYEFVGWNTDKNAKSGLRSVTFEGSDITVYAIYKKPIKVSYHTYDTDKDYVDTVDLYNNDSSVNVNLKYKLDEHSLYKFVGFTLNDVDSLVESITVSNNTDVYCVYDTISKLIYKDVDLSEIATDTATNRAKATDITNSEYLFIVRDKIPHDGYKFNGWVLENSDDVKNVFSPGYRFITKSNESVLIADETKIEEPPVITERKVTIKGTLKYSDGTPIANKTITLDNVEDTMPVVNDSSMPKTMVLAAVRYSTSTNEKGEYKFENVLVGEYTLTLSDGKEVLGSCQVNVTDTKKDSVDIIDERKDVEIEFNLTGDVIDVSALLAIEPPKDEPTTEETSTDVPTTTETPTTESTPTTTETPTTTTEKTPEEPTTETTDVVVKTGDNSPVVLVAIMMLSALCGMIAVVGIRKGKKDDE